MTGTATTEAGEFAHTYGLEVVVDPDEPADGPRRRARPHLQDRGRQVRRRRPTTSRSATTPASPCSSARSRSRSPSSSSRLLEQARHRRTRCSTRSSTSGRRTSSPRPVGPYGVTVATNMAGRGVDILLGGNPEGLAAQRDARRGAHARRATRSATRSSLERFKDAVRRPRATRSASSAASTCSAPSATRAAASTTSSGAAPAARATRARAASTSRSKTTSCGCSRPAR